MTIIHRIGSCSYKRKNIFLKCKKTFRITKARILFIPFRDSRRDKRVFQKIVFLIMFGARLTGIKWKIYSGCWFLNIL